MYYRSILKFNKSKILYVHVFSLVSAKKGSCVSRFKYLTGPTSFSTFVWVNPLDAKSLVACSMLESLGSKNLGVLHVFKKGFQPWGFQTGVCFVLCKLLAIFVALIMIGLSLGLCYNFSMFLEAWKANLRLTNLFQELSYWAGPGKVFSFLALNEWRCFGMSLLFMLAVRLEIGRKTSPPAASEGQWTA